MADFSHLQSLFWQPSAVARLVGKGETPTDEMLLEVFGRIDPPLLRPREAAAVGAILGHRRGRRPSRGVPSTRWLARQIVRLDRPDVDAVFLEVLSARIAGGKGLTEFDRSYRFTMRRRRSQRDDLIRGLYREIYRLLEGNPASIQHGVLGELKVPTGETTRRGRAAEMTHDVLRNRLGEIAPSNSRIVKIASMRR